MKNSEALRDCEHDIEVLCKRLVDAESKLKNIQPLIARLATFGGLHEPASPDAHDDAVQQLRKIIST